MIFTTGLRTQQQARQEILAATLVPEILANARTDWGLRFGLEGRRPEDRAGQEARAWAADLDAVTLMHSNRFTALPEDIGWRLDSEEDEIAKILDSGGRLYYVKDDNAFRTILFAFAGAPQLDAMKWLPQLRWPYYDLHPAPYQRGYADQHHVVTGLADGSGNPLCPDASYTHTQALIESSKTNYTNDDGLIHHKDYAGIGHDGAVLVRLHQNINAAGDGTSYPNYLTLSQELVDELDPANSDLLQPGFNDPTVLVPALRDVLTEIGMPLASDWGDYLEDTAAAHPGSPAEHEEYLALRALYRSDRDNAAYRGLRYLATAHLLRYLAFAYGKAAAGTGDNWPTNGNATARTLHSRADHLARHFSRTIQLFHPYEMRLPRDVAMPLFCDHPLLQQDVLGTPLADPNGIYTSASNHHNFAWDYLTSDTVAKPDNNGKFNIHSDSYSRFDAPFGNPEVALVNTDAGPDGSEHSRWTLTNRFDPKERCRMLVFFSVDWMSYRDFERTASAPADLSTNHYQLNLNDRSLSAAAPHDWSNGWMMTDKLLVGMVNGEGAGALSNSGSQWDTDADGRNDAQGIFGLGWKPKPLLRRPARGTDLMGNNAQNNLPFLERLTGKFGVDRNNNGELSQGHVEPQVRLRATTLLRTVVYDPRGFVPLD
jgi:hypothetical protein|nr:hypothetical protein [Planctomycetota bacterium]